MTPEMLAVRQRLKDDFDYYAKHALKIRTKKSEIKPLILNPAQRLLKEAVDEELANRGRVRIVILKARQQGLSTMVGGYLYYKVSQSSARKAMVITHHADSTRALFDMTKRYHDKCPEILKPHTKYSSRRELSFDLLDSAYTVATAGGDQAGRGETITDLHASELAFWPKGQAAELWNGLIQAVPETEDTNVFVESTANGVSGVFYNLWKGAVEGTNGFRPVFIPWFLDPDYRDDTVPDDFQRTPDEEDLAVKYSLDNAQLYWRRQQIGRTSAELFKQEYPSTPDEAFLTTGRPIFNPEQLTALMDEAKQHKLHATLALEGAEEIGFEWRENPRGELKCYYPHDPAETYYIGADVALGVRGGDWSVAVVMDSKKRVVAKYRAHVHPDYYAHILYHLGELYNNAKLIVESNNHGILTCTRLGKDLAYPNFYVEEQHDKLTDKFTEKLGFSSTVKTKPLIIDQLRAAMRENEIECRDQEVLREMLTYVVTEEGKMEAEDGCHDDCVMAMALCNHIHEGYFEPIPVVDDYYIEMV